MQAPSFEEVGLLNTQILWACFGLTTLLGWVMQRTHFCTMGAVSDIVNMGDWTRMRVWVMSLLAKQLDQHGAKVALSVVVNSLKCTVF